MTPNAATVARPSKMAWVGRVISGLLVLFFLFIGVTNVMKPELRFKEYEVFGYSPTVIVPIGITLVLCAIVYAIPQTAMIGAILLTGYFGGAMVTHMRVGQPFYFEMVIGVLVWLGLYLRDARVRALMALKK